MSSVMFFWINIGWIAIAVITLIVLLFTKIRAPYGRHANQNWGKMIANKWGWFWMELPAFLIMPMLTLLGPNSMSWFSWLLVGMWSLHYFNRTIVFPFRLRTNGKKMPLTIVFSAVFFNGVNGFLNGYYLGFMQHDAYHPYMYMTILGIVLFGCGMLINQITDSKLIALRKQQAGYQIPRGWLFEVISCPNHFGEILEWVGFALTAWNLPALTFSIWTFCNLVPRAINHHEWYHEHFNDYPSRRKAVIPWLF